jgi:hypothetical protein
MGSSCLCTLLITVIIGNVIIEVLLHIGTSVPENMITLARTYHSMFEHTDHISHRVDIDQDHALVDYPISLLGMGFAIGIPRFIIAKHGVNSDTNLEHHLV